MGYQVYEPAQAISPDRANRGNESSLPCVAPTQQTYSRVRPVYTEQRGNSEDFQVPSMPPNDSFTREELYPHDTDQVEPEPQEVECEPSPANGCLRWTTKNDSLKMLVKNMEERIEKEKKLTGKRCQEIQDRTGSPDKVAEFVDNQDKRHNETERAIKNYQNEIDNTPYNLYEDELQSFLEPCYEDVNEPPVFETFVVTTKLNKSMASLSLYQHTWLGLRFTMHNAETGKYERKQLKISFISNRSGQGFKNIMRHDNIDYYYADDSKDVISTKRQISYKTLGKVIKAIPQYFVDNSYSLLSTNCNKFVREMAGLAGLDDLVEIHSGVSPANVANRMLAKVMQGDDLDNYSIIHNAFEMTNKTYGGTEHDRRGEKNYNEKYEIKNLDVYGTPIKGNEFKDIAKSYARGDLNFIRRLFKSYRSKDAELEVGKTAGDIDNADKSTHELNNIEYSDEQNSGVIAKVIGWFAKIVQDTKSIVISAGPEHKWLNIYAMRIGNMFERIIYLLKSPLNVFNRSSNEPESESHGGTAVIPNQESTTADSNLDQETQANHSPINDDEEVRAEYLNLFNLNLFTNVKRNANIHAYFDNINKLKEVSDIVSEKNNSNMSNETFIIKMVNTAAIKTMEKTTIESIIEMIEVSEINYKFLEPFINDIPKPVCDYMTYALIIEFMKYIRNKYKDEGDTNLLILESLSMRLNHIANYSGGKVHISGRAFELKQKLANVMKPAKNNE